MRSRKASSGLRVWGISQPVPSVLGVNSLFKLKMPFGTSMNAMRIGRLASTAKAGVIASSIGKAITAPAPRKNVRRAMDFLKITIFCSPHLERGAVDDAKNNGRPLLVIRGSFARNLTNNGVVIFFDPATQRIGQEPFGEIFNEHIAFLQQDMAQTLRPIKRSAIGKGSRRIDRSQTGPQRVAPAADAVEIVQR